MSAHLRRPDLRRGAGVLLAGGVGQATVPRTTESPSLFTDPSIDFSWFPLDNPGIVSIPLGFLCGWLGTVLSKEHNEDKYAELEVRSLTGVGMEKAVRALSRSRAGGASRLPGSSPGSRFAPLAEV